MSGNLHHHQPIGQTLIALGLISSDQLHIALREQTRTREIIGRQLVRLGFLSEATLRDALAHSLDQTCADLNGLLPDAEALALIPRQAARRLGLIPLSYDSQQRHLVAASSNTRDIVAQDQLRSLLPSGATIELRLAGDSEIACAIDMLYGHELSIDGILHEIETGETDITSLANRGDTYAQPVVRLIDALLAERNVTRAARRVGGSPSITGCAASAKAASAAPRFIATPTAIVTDIGTEFGVEVDRVRDREARQSVDVTRPEQLGDMAVRLVGDPLVDGPARGIGVGDVVEAVERRRIGARREVEVGLLEREILLAEHAIRDPELVATPLVHASEIREERAELRVIRGLVALYRERRPELVRGGAARPAERHPERRRHDGGAAVSTDGHNEQAALNDR